MTVAYSVVEGTADAATGTAVVYFDEYVSASDDVGVVDFFCDTTSGSAFGVGDTAVTCTAVDTVGQADYGSFTVRVSSAPDATAPVVTVPGDITVPATSADGALVSYVVTAEDDLEGPVNPDCVNDSSVAVASVASEALFPVGATTISCTAIDTNGNAGYGSFTVTVEKAPAGPPTIKSDLADYPPGALVTLRGANWQPGEVVRIDVNDDYGQTWRWTVDVTADADGKIIDVFNLPDWFVAIYYVTATGSVSGTAKTTFTDASLVVQPGPTGNSPSVTFVVTYQNFTDSDCTQSAGSSQTQLINVDRGVNLGGLGNSAYVKLTVPSTPSTPSNYTFDYWSTGTGVTGGTNGTRSDNPIPNTPTRSICVRNPGEAQGDAYKANYKVAQATTSLAVSAATGTYGGTTNLSATLTLTADGSGVSGKTVTFTLNGTSVGSATTNSSGVATISNVSLSGINVGTYSTAIGAAFAADSSYSGSTGTGSLTVAAKELTGSFTAQSKVYDGTTAATISGRSVTGKVGTDDVSLTGGTATFDNANVGTGKTVTGTGFTLSGTAADNYTLASSTLTTTANITAKAVTITPTSGQSKVYGSDGPTLTFTNDSGLAPAAFTGALSREGGNDVGAYAITLGSLSAGPNYNLVLATPAVTFAITARAVEVTADAKSKTYGDTDPMLTYTVTAGDLVEGDSFAGSLTRDAGENVGTYAITQGDLALNGNYALSFVPSTLTIGQRAVEVTADAQSKTYGDADPTLGYSVTAGNLIGTDGFTGTLARDPGENVGTYAITQGTLTAGGNYALSFVGNNLTIGARAVQVTADGQSKTYGDADPTLGYSVTAGNLIGTDGFTGTLARDPGENVGTYAITQGTLSAGGNYALTYAGANLTITARPITVTVDPQSKVYGDADPALTYRITAGNLVNRDTFTGSLTRVAGASVGTYAIQQGTLALSGNYTLSYVGADLTITPRPLAVKADDKTKVLGAVDPALTYTITSGNLVAGDTFSGALTRAAGETVGSYAITQGTLALSANYALSFTPGTLKITYAPNSVSCAGSPSRTILQPINADGTSVFKLGSTVPAKFRVCDANGNSIGTAGVVASFQLISTTSGTVTTTVTEEVLSTTPDTAFRWDATNQQWIFNISTKNLSSGLTYTYRVTLNDGTSFTFTFGIRK